MAEATPTAPKKAGRPKKTAAERAAEKKAADEREIAVRKNPDAAEQPAPPRRSAANTGAIENVAIAAQRVPGAGKAEAPKPDKDGNFWPSWRYGPDGQGKIFNSADEVPKGWKDHPGAFLDL